MNPDAVAVVVTCYNLGRTLREAVGSVRRQTRPPAELLIIDDGSDDLYTVQTLGHLEGEGERVVHTDNRGVSAARNTGIRLVSAPRILVLDADDVLAPQFLEKMGARLDQDASLDFVSCGMQGFGASSYVWFPPEPRLPDSLIRGIVHVSSMFRRVVWETVGGFNEGVHRSEDLEFWTRVLELGFRGGVINEPLLHYRVRGDSRYHEALLADGHAACMSDFYRRHWHTASQYAEELFVGKESFLIEQHAHHAHVCQEIQHAQAEAGALRSEIARLQAEVAALGRPALDMGELRRTTPFSSTWGVDRGKPLDRFYIETFLDRHREDVHGRVLEVKDPGYTLMFGGDRVIQSDVLDIDVSNEQATVHADLAQAEVIPDERYDAVILTQTLGLIYDVGAAIRHTCRILKPGGVLLCTVPAAGRVSHEDNGPDGDYWRFTEASLRRLFAEVFPLESFEITGFGNVLACTAFLYGLADHELTLEELQVVDPHLPLVYGIRAVRPQLAPSGAGHARLSAGRAGPTSAGRPAAAPRESADRAVILAYHRVGDRVHPESLAMPTAAFNAQVAYVRDHCQPVSLDDLAEAAASRHMPDRGVAITFDDGYLDVLTNAAPILADAGVPATAFITGHGEHGDLEFYWDVLGRIFTPGRSLPPELTLPEAGFHGVATATRSERERVLKHLMARFYPLAEDQREALAGRLLEWSSVGKRPEGPRPLTADEVARLGSLPGITIGAHSRHHLCLPLHDEETQRAEIAQNRRWLEETVGREVTAFAYPYGERNPTSLRIVREVGFRIGVTVDETPVEPGWPRLLLPRCEVLTADVAGFATWLDELLSAKR